MELSNKSLMECENLNIGDTSTDSHVEIVDKDRLCYLVKVESRGAYGLRTISKRLLQEFIDYFKTNPDKTANDARDALTGQSDIDRFAYGYAATLTRMAKMVLNPHAECIRKEPFASCSSESSISLKFPLQQIHYGAPGTGKSYEIDTLTKGFDTIRTTFHPDSDYSTFVGAYKPTMEEVDVQIVPVAVAGGITLDTNRGTYKERRITYKFVKQAFLKAYLGAWQKYAEAKEGAVEPQYLVIEEINRGNCAQIFGDLFQLLDRQDNGFSSYPIEADADLQREIAEAFAEGGEYALPGGGLKLGEAVKGYSGDLASDISSGRVLLLPNNLYIWATMNTSDQSLFPIDSAFKRRWDWKYVKISDAKKGYKIKCGDEECDWWIFISAVNQKIADETNSDDKKLGYFFCKPDKEGGYISEERFVSKVIFYLWNDVFKDGDTELFNVTGDSHTATFEAFYKDDNTVNEANVRQFIVNVVGEENLKPKDGDKVEEESQE